MNIQSAIIVGANILRNEYISTAELDCEILMSKAINQDRKYIFLNHDKILKKEEINCYLNLVRERSYRKPIAHLINKKFFWNSEFYITNDTLIPRPDTELIIEKVLELTKFQNKMSILDIGVGSGSILLSILKEKKIFMEQELILVKNV